MAARKGETSTGRAASSSALAAPAADTAGLEPKALAEGILARTIRPRAADVRRLAEAVLEAGRKPAKKKRKKDDKKADRKKRKLSKIPGQDK